MTKMATTPIFGKKNPKDFTFLIREMVSTPGPLYNTEDRIHTVHRVS